jgi:hypothetical protein
MDQNKNRTKGVWRAERRLERTLEINNSATSDDKGGDMTERILRCPRCGKATPIAGGRCQFCGLAVSLAPRARRRDAPVGRRGGGQIDVGVDRVEREFAGVSFAPAKRGAAGAGTQRYDVADLRPRAAGRAGKANGAAAAPGIDSGRYDANDGGQVGAEPKGGRVEVGALSSMLMDPTENPHENEFDKRGLETATDGKLDVAQRLYGETDTARDNLSFLAPPPAEAPDAPEPATFVPKRFPGASSADAHNSHAATDERRRYLLTRVLPLFVALLLVGFVGRRFVNGPIALADVYKVLFADDHGRKVTCQATFSSNPEDRLAVHGMFECKLYENDFSTDRVDEPQALKLIIGNGAVAFAGRYDADGIKLQLGAFEAADSRAVRLTGRFVGDASHIVGQIENDLGQRAKVEMEKKL